MFSNALLKTFTLVNYNVGNLNKFEIILDFPYNEVKFLILHSNTSVERKVIVKTIT